MFLGTKHIGQLHSLCGSVTFAAVADCAHKTDIQDSGRAIFIHFN